MCNREEKRDVEKMRREKEKEDKCIRVMGKRRGLERSERGEKKIKQKEGKEK